MERVQTLLKSGSPEETVMLGREFGRQLKEGDIVALSGSLGSGKTTFVKGLALGLGVAHESDVKSPTYVLVHRYAGRCPVYHLDLFRLDSLADVEGLGWDDLADGGGVVLIEWARKIDGYLPQDYLEFEFQTEDQESRSIQINPKGEHYRKITRDVLRHWKQAKKS